MTGYETKSLCFDDIEKGQEYLTNSHIITFRARSCKNYFFSIISA